MDRVSAEALKILKRVEDGEVDLRIAADRLGIGFDQDVIREILNRAVRVETEFREGAIVHKPSGYRYPGIIVCVFRTLHGKVRYVVEATGTGYEEMLHIFNGDQLALTPPDLNDR